MRSSFQTGSIIATMIVSFAATVAVLTWQAHGAAAPAERRYGPLQTVETARPNAPPTAISPAIPSGPVVVAVPHNFPVAPVADASPSPAEELPVRIMFRRQADRNSVVAHLFSGSAQSLDVAVTAVSKSTGATSELRITLAPNSQSVIGENDGLDLARGGTMTMHSPPYADLVRSIP
jgi:hypothetical protein